MRAAALIVVASALAACNASLDLGGNDDPGSGGGGSGPGTVTSTTTGGGGDGATGSSTSASSASGDAGGGGSANTTSGSGGPGGGGGGEPLGACPVPEGAIVPEAIVEVPSTVTNAFAVGDARIALSVENEDGPWPTLLRLDRDTMTPLDDGIDVGTLPLAFAGDILFGADFCGPWRESGDLAVPLLPSCTDGLVYSVASDGTTVVFGEMDRLWAAPADGSGAPTLLLELGRAGVVDSIFSDVVIDGPVAYVVAPAFSETEVVGGRGSVWRTALDGSFRQLVGETPTSWNAEAPAFGPTRVVVDDTHVYWNDAAEGQVYRADKDFGEPEVIMDVDSPVDIAMVDGDLVVAEVPADCRGTILHRLAGGTGAPTTIAVVDERVTVEGAGDDLFMVSVHDFEPIGARIYRLAP